ncbi:uncharacterized protein LOC103712405 isoform X2 [Phoenix dactylifera]|uniref:Uncharacterized protein LOC103712405 isoform X2 n=1 Tax=Phoenix dactylifera TaxID=42345 RepID=A0A8B8ZEL5_PHODC|nr:uncharacterized protein LOC103712405 isoform X2 [Phoenix dactylifera]
MEFHSSSKRMGEEEPRSPLPSSKKQRIPIPELGFFHLRPLTGGPDPPRELICRRSDRVYIAGRERRRCEIVLRHRCISRRHCQFFLDGSDRKLQLMDGFFLTDTSDLDEIRRRFRSAGEGLASRVSLNGVFINGRRLPKGIAAELTVGDEILLGCWKPSDGNCRIKYGFVVERILFSEVTGRFDTKDALFPKGNVICEDTALCRSEFEELVPRAVFLLNELRSILGCSDPVSYLRSSFNLDHHGRRTAEPEAERVVEHGSKEIHPLDTEKRSKLGATWRNAAIEVISSEESDRNVVGNYEHGECSMNPVGKSEHTHSQSHPNKDVGIGCYSNGKTFFLNRLEFMGPGTSDQHAGITLPELLHPIESLIRVFIATFTCDVSWFLSCCQVPNHLPITIACHSGERCWSSSHDSRTSSPYVNYPNLLLVYPPFCDVIAFGKDRKKQGIACHHPKLIVLQRKHSIRVVITSANLVPKQWNHITNTVWWQDFPRRTAPDYSALLGTIEDSKSDFAAQLAGFIASLITDVPSQAHWIKELTKYDFGGAVGHLVASVPGIHAQSSCYLDADYCLSAQQIVHSKSVAGKFLGYVHASVVGLSHRFHAATDSNCAQVKMLASLLGKCRENSSGTIEVLLKRNMNIPADANAVSILVADLNEFSVGDAVQLGFLPRDAAKWVSPLSDAGFFNFSAYIYPKEALAAAFEGGNMKVQLILRGPKFSEISRLIQPHHVASLCSLLSSIQRCLGLWRLQEVLSRYKWLDSLETDFIYGSSSIGTSVNSQFLAAFSAAAGKRSYQYPESEESDPEWGCWTAVHESRNPSMRILFPTIERVKNGSCGIQPFRCLLSLSEKTWQRLRTAGIFHDAIPHPCNRVGYPMHVKVARRRFVSKATMSSFGWIYCGSHNFSPAAWGRTAVSTASSLRLHICNYELGILLIAPPSDTSEGTDGKTFNLDDIALPFVMPAPKYQDSDRPATAQAMREAVAVLQRDKSSAAVAMEEVNEDIPDEEEEVFEASDYFTEEKEEEKIYAEMLWSQVDSES